MSKLYSVIFLFAFQSTLGSACTAFLMSSSKNSLMGKSYDWYLIHGYATVNKHHVLKTAFKLPFENPVTWKSKYGSVTFNQYGREFPLGGINEQGLAVEVLWLGGTEYPTKDERLSINELQWIQYQLDNFATVSEVVENVEKTRISKVLADVHYFICDRNAKCTTVDYLKGKAVVHTTTELPYPLITNNTYSESLSFLKKHVGFGGSLSIPDSRESLDRFVRAASHIKEKTSSTSNAFSTLASVQQGGYSVWNIVYDLKRGLASFRTSSLTKVREIDTKVFDFSCKSPVLTLDMRRDLSGSVSSLFTEYSAKENREMIEKSFDQTPLKQALAPQMAEYPDTTECLED